MFVILFYFVVSSLNAHHQEVFTYNYTTLKIQCHIVNLMVQNYILHFVIKMLYMCKCIFVLWALFCIFCFLVNFLWFVLYVLIYLTQIQAFKQLVLMSEASCHRLISEFALFQKDTSAVISASYTHTHRHAVCTRPEWPWRVNADSFTFISRIFCQYFVYLFNAALLWSTTAIFLPPSLVPAKSTTIGNTATAPPTDN